MKALALLLVLLSLAFLAGCDHGIEPRGGAEAGAGDCGDLAAGVEGSGANRVFRYVAGVSFGESPPSTIKSKTGSGSMTYLDRSSATSRKDGPTSFAIVWTYLGIALAVVAGLIALSAAGMLKKEGWPALVMLLVGAVVLVLAAGVGWLGGSIYTLDNASTVPVEVAIDGNPIPIPAYSFVEVRLWGGEHTTEAKTSGKTLERVVLRPDEDFGDAFKRGLFGHGRFIYSVCGRSRYSVLTAHYGRR